VTARAHVEQDFVRRGVAVYLGWTDGADRMHVVEPVTLSVTVTEAGSAAVTSEPSLRLSEELARALLDALSAHFGGSSDVQTLRGDYMAERARVDRLIGYLTAPEQIITRAEPRL
jgi:hypothetical protein